LDLGDNPQSDLLDVLIVGSFLAWMSQATSRIKRGRTKPRIAILTGAGASHGAGSVSPRPPPLGGGLFEALVEKYPASWGSLPTAIAEAFKADFEATMIGLWDSFSDQASKLLIDMGMFFSTFEPSGSDDCYSELVRCLVESHLVRTTAIGTLNYECILEVAASHLSLKIAYLAESPPPNNLLIWKLHGSCNVLAKAKVYGINVVLSDPANQGYFDGDVEVVDLPEVRRRYRSDFAIPPVMSLYAPGKPTLV